MHGCIVHSNKQTSPLTSPSPEQPAGPNTESSSHRGLHQLAGGAQAVSQLCGSGFLLYPNLPVLSFPGCRELLDNANELRLMLCREKYQGTKRGTSVIAACGRLWPDRQWGCGAMVSRPISMGRCVAAPPSLTHPLRHPWPAQGSL